MQTLETAGSRVTCSSCGADVSQGGPLCEACGRLQPPRPDVSYFDVFGLAPKLDLDLAALEKYFYRASRKLHPDAYARASQQEQEWSLAHTSLLNDAYRTLKSPVERTKYLLKLEGVKFEDDQSSGPGGTNPSTPPADLLEEVFELNMQLEELRGNKKMGEDDPQLRSDLERSKMDFLGRLDSLDGDLRSFWLVWDEAAAQNDTAKKTDALQAMTSLLQRRSYLQNLIRDVSETLGES
jgi:molecular chaperone HscB